MGDYELLSKIKSPADVKRLDEKDLAKLCSEIREKLIETVSLNGGHLSPNLGVVELTVALHRALICPKTALYGMWDIRVILINCLREDLTIFIHCAKKAAFRVFLNAVKASMMILIQATAVHLFLRHTVLQEQRC
mgnify:CR=1 FL=1